jgi:hypothetical protein
MLNFEESGMQFSFREIESFYIEKNSIYKEKLQSHSISTVECVTSRSNKIQDRVYFIEAKTSAPAPTGERGQLRFDEFIEEISKKFLHSLNFCYALLHDVQCTRDNEPFPMGEQLVTRLSNGPYIVAVLIVKNNRLDWCEPLKLALEKKMQPITYIWKIKFIVLDEKSAKDKHLIQ